MKKVGKCKGFISKSLRFVSIIKSFQFLQLQMQNIWLSSQVMAKSLKLQMKKCVAGDIISKTIVCLYIDTR